LLWIVELPLASGLIAVEDAIRSIIDVTDCAVTVHRGNEHTPHLVAWVQSTEATTEHVRAAVARELGDAAVPKAVHIVATLPHLPNGKIDRQALERHGNGG
jgi:acyl-coenzyme A synthetase/AMP-(fatty) acid ligase